jgi:hypothetical protein
VLGIFQSDHSDGQDTSRRWEVGEDISLAEMRQSYINTHPEIAESGEFISDISVRRYQGELEAEDIITELDENDEKED